MGRIWFLTGSQHLYGPTALAQVAEQSRTVSGALAAAPDIVAEIVAKPVLTDTDAIRRIMLEANADDDCVGVICWMHTFSPAKMWITGLDLLRKPMLHQHTQVNRDLPWASIDMDFMNLNQAAHGDREFAYITARLSTPRTIVAGHVSNPEVVRRVGVWVRACLGAHALRTLKVVRFGDNMRFVAVTEGDKVEVERRFGTSVNTYGVNDLAAAIAEVSPGEAEELSGAYEEMYEVAPDLRAGGERHGALTYAASQEIALRRFLEEGGYGAFTTNFEDLGALQQLPGLAVQRLMGDGYGFGGEGDWKTAILGRALSTMAAGLPGGTSFMEDYTYHLDPGNELILGAHMLEVSPAIAATTPRIEIHPLGIGDRSDPVRMVFDAAPGAGVTLGLSDLGERLRFVANEVEVVPAPHPMPNLPVARAVWRPAPSFSTSTECWLRAGGPHHTVLSTQVRAEHLQELAQITGVELALIDASTTVRGFADTLRFEAAFWRLNRGL